MNTIAIATADMTGAYVASAIRNKRPDLNITLLYDPKEHTEEFIEAVDKKLESFNVDYNLVVLSEKTGSKYDFFSTVNALCEAEMDLDLGTRGLDTAILYRSVLDGLFQRSFVLDVIDNYMARVPADIRSVKLALPGYNYRAEDFVCALEVNEVEVIDPLDVWLKKIPKIQSEGILRFYWTQRAFQIERRFSEIFQEPVLFRTYYKHPWLRGESMQKKSQ